MTVHDGNGWKITPLSGWVLEVEGNISTLYHPKGVGAIQISKYSKDSAVTKADLLDLASEHIEAGANYKEYEENFLKVLTFAFGHDGEFWQHWYIAISSGVLFITYNCDEADREVELEQVKSMVATVSAT